jgi:hypothetical protein
MSMLWLILPAAAVGLLLWCCLALSGDLAEAEERERGARRS